MILKECPNGSTVKCPQCGAQATVEPSRQYASARQPDNPNWKILDCTRCRKTQYPSAKPVALFIPDPQSQPETKAVKRGR